MNRNIPIPDVYPCKELEQAKCQKWLSDRFASGRIDVSIVLSYSSFSSSCFLQLVFVYSSDVGL